MRKPVKIIYEISCFIVFFFLSTFSAYSVASRIIYKMQPDRPVEDIQRYIESGGPGIAIFGGFFFILFLILLYVIKSIVEKRLKKEA
ncbi:hypothetical protein ACFL1E_00990 [Candidatus Omnitrophota bacterium]